MKLKALVLDDSKVMRTMVMKALEKTKLAKFSFIEARDGLDGLAKFNHEKIDICFVDWNMPNMSGFDFAKKVRATGSGKNIPIIMVTSEKSMGKMMDAMDQAGANGYICKPFTVQELHQKLDPIIKKMK